MTACYGRARERSGDRIAVPLLHGEHGVYGKQVMAFHITMWCGCQLYVTCDPLTGAADTRRIQRRGAACLEDGHEVGVHLPVWELLPKPARFDRRAGYIFRLRPCSSAEPLADQRVTFPDSGSAGA